MVIPVLLGWWIQVHQRTEWHCLVATHNEGMTDAQQVHRYVCRAEASFYLSMLAAIRHARSQSQLQARSRSQSRHGAFARWISSSNHDSPRTGHHICQRYSAPLLQKKTTAQAKSFFLVLYVFIKWQAKTILQNRTICLSHPVVEGVK